MEAGSTIFESRLRGLQDRLRTLDSDRSQRGAARRSRIRNLLGFGVPFLLSNVFHALQQTDDEPQRRATESFRAFRRDGGSMPRRINGIGDDIQLARDIAALVRHLKRLVDVEALSEVAAEMDPDLIVECGAYFGALCSERAWASRHGDPWPSPNSS